MPEGPAYVIIGASLAGAKAAETLRGDGFGGPIVLLGTEADRPYERPPLSKGYLLGKADRSSLFVHDEHWYAGHQVDLRLGVTAVGIDREGRRVDLDTGDSVGYGRLLLTTGASPRVLPVPGADLDGVHYLRTTAESEALATALAPIPGEGTRVVIVGGGWIGLEVAAAAREKGCAVTVLEPEPTPLHRQVGPELGQRFADLHREHGVEFRLGDSAREFRAGEEGRVTAVLTSEGAELPADVVVVAIGAAPNVAVAEAAGLELATPEAGGGVLVDAALRTSDPDIFAAGDVANVAHPLLGRRVRVEHWANALHGGPAAARSMLGQPVSYDRVPYFFSDQYDLGMETSGLPEPGHYDQVVYRGDPATLEFIAFWLSGGAVVAGMNVNVWDVTDDIQALIRAGYGGTPVDAGRLTDPGVPLAEVLAAR